MCESDKRRIVWDAFTHTLLVMRITRQTHQLLRFRPTIDVGIYDIARLKNWNWTIYKSFELIVTLNGFVFNSGAFRHHIKDAVIFVLLLYASILKTWAIAIQITLPRKCGSIFFKILVYTNNYYINAISNSNFNLSKITNGWEKILILKGRKSGRVRFLFNAVIYVD